MPVVEIHLVEGQHTPTRVEELLRRAGESCATVLETPIGDVRAFVTLHPPELWATGGVPATVDGDPAPYFVATVLEGHPSARRRRLLAELTDVLCDVLAVTRVRVRGRIAQVPADDWSAGGLSPSSRHRSETVTRSPLL